MNLFANNGSEKETHPLDVQNQAIADSTISQQVGSASMCLSEMGSEKDTIIDLEHFDEPKSVQENSEVGKTGICTTISEAPQPSLFIKVEVPLSLDPKGNADVVGPRVATAGTTDNFSARDAVSDFCSLPQTYRCLSTESSILPNDSCMLPTDDGSLPSASNTPSADSGSNQSAARMLPTDFRLLQL